MLSCLVPDVEVELSSSSQMNLPITENDEKLSVVIKTIINHDVKKTRLCFSEVCNIH